MTDLQASAPTLALINRPHSIRAMAAHPLDIYPVAKPEQLLAILL